MNCAHNLDVETPYVKGVVAAVAQVSSKGRCASMLVHPPCAVVFEVRDGDRLFRLNHPLVLNEFTEDGMTYLESRGLSLLSFGSSEVEAAHSFQEDFAAMWDALIDSPDAELTPEAVDVKRNLSVVVNSIVNV